MTTLLQAGDKAPSFKMPSTNGPVSLKDYAGQHLILYFYPKDNTPGCTTEANDFSADLAKFTAAGAQILGVSKDSLKKHENFIAKHDLKIPLASDESGEVCEAYGVWVEKNMYGKKYMGIQRATFLIDPKGKIQHTWPKVRVKGHAEEVLTVLTT